jgi:hypothetical protein
LSFFLIEGKACNLVMESPFLEIPKVFLVIISHFVIALLVVKTCLMRSSSNMVILAYHLNHQKYFFPNMNTNIEKVERLMRKI